MSTTASEYVVRELESYVRGGTACLAKVGDSYYFVSSIPAAPDHGGPETLAFPCDENGEVDEWTDMAGGRGMSREETIAQLVEKGEAPFESGVTDLFSAMRVVAMPPGPSYYKDPS